MTKNGSNSPKFVSWNGAGWFFFNRIDPINAGSRTDRKGAKERYQVTFTWHSPRFLLVLHRPLLNRGVDSVEIGNAKVRLGSVARLHEIGNGDCQHQWDNEQREGNADIAGNQTTESKTSTFKRTSRAADP